MSETNNPDGAGGQPSSLQGVGLRTFDGNGSSKLNIAELAAMFHVPPLVKPYEPGYGDLTRFNTSRTILDATGPELLRDIVGEIMVLLGTSCAVYEKNGDYALGIFSSGWCRLMDEASYKRCGTSNPQQALSCGQWLCHESCWLKASKTAMEKDSAADVECEGGLHLFALPIRAGSEIVGAINFGYGDPPRSPEKLVALSRKFGLPVAVLTQAAAQYESRPAFIIEIARKRLE